MPQLPKVDYQEPEIEPAEIDEKTWLRVPMKCLTHTYQQQKEATPDKSFETKVLYGVRVVYDASSLPPSSHHSAKYCAL